MAAAGGSERDIARLTEPVRAAPFRTGLQATLGALAAYVLLQAVAAVREVLVLILLSAFIAIGLSPAVEYLRRRGWPRGLAVAGVLLGLVALVVGAIATFAPALVSEADKLIRTAPQLLNDLRRIPLLAHLDGQYHVVAKAQQKLTETVSAHPERVIGGVLGLGRALLGLAGSVVAVLVLTAYFLAHGPNLSRYLHRLVPRSRRARVVLLTDEVAARIGGYILGKLIVAVLAGTVEFVFLIVLHVPFAAALAVLTGLLSLIPLVGGYAAGTVVAIVALTVSVKVTVIVLLLMLVYRLIEDYLVTPRVMRRSVDISPVLTIVSVFLGGAVLGLVGALLAIPVAASLQLIGREVAVRRLDEM